MGHSKYPDDWDQRRKAVYQRDNHTCQNCGAKNAELHAHHKVPLSKGGSNSVDNLITLCAGCHSHVHGRPIGSAAAKSQEPTGRDWKWGGPLDHAVVGALTLGLGNIPWAASCRIGHSVRSLFTRDKD